MVKKQYHYTIPVFIPEVACPNRCIYCNQHSISGQLKAPAPHEVIEIVESHLKTIPKSDAFVEIGFFGGNFTGIPIQEQQMYLQMATPYMAKGKIQAIRLSTRPDYINDEVLLMLKQHHVQTIELGAQSMDDEVLKASGRGHNSGQIVLAATKIKQYGFRLGLQMMIGLPFDSFEKSFSTAHKFVQLGALDVRIYPTVVIKGTELETLYEKGIYSPLSLSEAVNWSKDIFILFEDHKINIIRTGLHPSEALVKGDAIVAGPFHPSFKELVLTKIWNDILNDAIDMKRGKRIRIYIAKGQLNYAVGYNSENKNKLAAHFTKLQFIESPDVKGRKCHVDYY